MLRIILAFSLVGSFSYAQPPLVKEEKIQDKTLLEKPIRDLESDRNLDASDPKTQTPKTNKKKKKKSPWGPNALEVAPAPIPKDK